MSDNRVKIIYQSKQKEYQKVIGNQCYLCYQNVDTNAVWLSKNCSVTHSKCHVKKYSQIKKYIKTGYH